MQRLSKLAKNKNTFICDFVLAMKFCDLKMYTMYVDLDEQYS